MWSWKHDDVVFDKSGADGNLHLPFSPVRHLAGVSSSPTAVTPATGAWLQSARNVRILAVGRQRGGSEEERP